MDNIVLFGQCFLLFVCPTMSDQLRRLLGRKIKYRREESGLTQRQLGKAINYSYSQISKFERGDRDLNLIVAFDMAEAMDCSVEDFLPEEGNPFDY